MKKKKKIIFLFLNSPLLNKSYIMQTVDANWSVFMFSLHYFDNLLWRSKA